MLIKTHMIPVKKEDSNKGSCGGLANYLSKESGSQFFSHDRNGIDTEEAVEIVDNHSKGRLGKNESKWYSPMYSLSTDECKHIVGMLFKKEYENFNDLSPEEQEQYNSYVIHLARRFQDVMAANFGKQELGINSGADLVYVGVVENKRFYKPWDLDVRGGQAKSGDPKPGFNTHIHIIQSRKANNEKNSKISPESKYKSRTNNNFANDAKGGFDRGAFYTLIEETFDQITKFDRNYTETFEYKNGAKKEKYSNEEGLNNVRNINTKNDKVMQKKKFYTVEDQKAIFENSKLVDYFFSLAERGKLRYEGKRGNDYIFNNLSQNSGSISVHEYKGWKDFSSGEGGKILMAVRHFENLGHKEALDFLVDKHGFSGYEIQDQNLKSERERKGTSTSPAKVLNIGEVKNPYIVNYFLTRGISMDIIKENVQEVKYERNGRHYTSGGIANIAGGFNVRTANFKGVVGDNNDISVIEGNDKVLVFEGLVSYLSWLELNKKTKAEETVVILNSVGNNKSFFALLEQRNTQKVSACVDADAAGDSFMKELRDKFTGELEDLRGEYSLEEGIDLNDRLVLQQVTNISRKL